MSVKIIAQVNAFSSERQEYDLEPCKVIDILKKIDVSGIVETGWRVMLNDEIIDDYEKETKDGDRLYIKVVPEGDNKDTGKGMGWAGAAMIIAGGILVFTGVGAPFGAALVGAGVGCLAGGIALYNMDIPELGDRESPEQDPSIRGSRNQMRERGYIPALFGRRRVYSDLASQYYTWVEDGKQYLYQLFCCGQKDQHIDVSTIKIADTLLSEYSATGDISKVLSGEDELLHMQIAYGESTTPIITKCVHESQHNSVLNHETEDGLDASLIETTVDDTEEIHVDILFNSGLGKYNNKGKLDKASVKITAQYKPDGAPDTAYKTLGHFSGDTDTIIKNELKTLRYSIHKTGLTPGKYSVKLTRVTADSKDSKTVDKCYVGSIRSIKNESPISRQKAKMLTLIGLKIRVSEKLNGIVDQLNFESESVLPVLSGSSGTAADWTTSAPSSNPASCAIWAMKGPYAQQPLQNSQIDWPAFARLYSWCAVHNYQCNAYLSESMTIQQLLSAIASTCRAEIFRVNGVITVVQDIERDSFVQLFTPRNSWDYQETISFTEIPDAMAVSFDNKEVGYAQDELMLYNTPTFQELEEPQEISDVKTWGVTDKDQAKRLGIYKYAVTRNRPIITTFKCDIEYMLCSKGDWIKYAGDVALAGIKQGRITAIQRDINNKVVSFESDEILPMEENKNYAIRVRLADASSVLLNILTAEGGQTKVYLAESVVLNIQENDLFAFGERGAETVDLVVTDISCEENLTASITAVGYAPEIFGLDNPGFILPPFRTNLSSYSGAIDTGQTNTDGWQTFYTFNDSYEEPERPNGGGTDGGWHRIQTQESKWISIKVAKTIYSGAWSAPSRTGEAAAFIAESAQAAVSKLFNTRQVTLYKKVSGQISSTGISTGLFVNFSYKEDDMALSWINPSDSNGWDWHYPVNVEEGENVYVTVATAQSRVLTDTIAYTQWPEPIITGHNGSNGYNTFTIRLWQRSAEVPSASPEGVVYNFQTGALSFTNMHGWQRSTPEVSDDPLWETYATALTTEATDTIRDGYTGAQGGEWSYPVKISANSTISMADVKAYIDSTIEARLPDPVVTVNYSSGVFAVNSYHKTEKAQSITLTYRAVQENTELDFTFDTAAINAVLPAGWSYTIDGKSITLRVGSNVRVWGGNFPVTIRFAKFLYDYFIGWETESEEFLLGLDDFVLGYEELEKDEDGNILYTTREIGFTYSGIDGGINRGNINSISDLKNIDWNIGDYFVWGGSDTAYSLSQTGQFYKSIIYKYVGEGGSWTFEEDRDTGHFAGSLSGVLGVLEEQLGKNNSEAEEFLDKLTANVIFAKKIVANDVFARTVSARLATIKGEGTVLNTLQNYIDSKTSAEIKQLLKETGLNTMENKTIIDGGYLKTSIIKAASIKAAMIDIDNVFAQNIKATGSIRVGVRYDKDGNINRDYQSSLGAWLGKNGMLKANKAELDNVKARGGTFEGAVKSSEGIFTKDFYAPSMTVLQEARGNISIDLWQENYTSLKQKLDWLLDNAKRPFSWYYSSLESSPSKGMYIDVTSLDDNNPYVTYTIVGKTPVAKASTMLIRFYEYLGNYRNELTYILYDSAGNQRTLIRDGQIMYHSNISDKLYFGYENRRCIVDAPYFYASKIYTMHGYEYSNRASNNYEFAPRRKDLFKSFSEAGIAKYFTAVLLGFRNSDNKLNLKPSYVVLSDGIYKVYVNDKIYDVSSDDETHLVIDGRRLCDLYF